MPTIYNVINNVIKCSEINSFWIYGVISKIEAT